MAARHLARLAARLAAVPVEGWITAAVVAVCSGFVLQQLQPDLLLADTTPAGGDMGAHVWAPAYLRDHLLPHGRLTGWTPDWYAGFPAYHFYMVVPSLFILLLDLVLPYGVAFKLVTVSGVVTLPVAAWAFGRLAGLRFPSPALLAVATVPFLFDRSFTIYGGNIASTLAGEFAFSISLSLALVYLGFVARGLRTGAHRGTAAVLLALAGLCHLIPAFFALAGTAVLFTLHRGRGRLRWVATMAPVAGAISAFWVLPFVWRRAYLNDMGWEKLTTYVELLAPPDLRWVMALAVCGAVFGVVTRHRAVLALVVLAVIGALAVRYLPQGRLWNARVLPFYYLCCYLLAGLALSEGARLVARLMAVDPRRPLVAVTRATPVMALGAMLLVVGLPLGALPLGNRGSDGVFRWAGLATADRSFIPGWAEWNYSGYERKPAYPEYHGVVTTMAELGRERGCGRAMWEYESQLDRYGTPMALMLLPHWTDGCIGSMEGLYFEASATTPYHFLNQDQLSEAPSNAQRDLPYQPGPPSRRDFDLGVAHLQLLGVRYYLAFSDTALRLAASHRDLTEVARSGPWTVYEVEGSDLVTPLDYEPAVLTGVSDAQHEWIDPAIAFYQDRAAWDVLLASSGPERWQRVAADGGTAERRRLAPARASNAVEADDRISFDVDRPGTPVLVKASYFPNWQVSGAEGPFRVAPNLMVVVPTDTHVELRYGWTGIDGLAWLLTLAGLVGLVALRRPVAVAPAASPTDEPREPGPAAGPHLAEDLVGAGRSQPG